MEDDASFNLLKQKLISPPILQYPDFSKTFILTTDASNYALGAVLAQGEIGQELPICYASRSLIKSELNKPIIEKELLAIYWGINYFRPYLFGRKFYVITDHRPLVSLFAHKNPSSKMTRIRTELSDYDFEIIFKAGKYNTNADALSRITIDSDVLKSMIPTNSVNVVTRSMTKASTKPLDNDSHAVIQKQKSDQLFAWQAVSISEVRNVINLKFVRENYINSPSITFENKEIIVTYNLSKSFNIIDIFNQLVTSMFNMDINKLALKSNSEIFDYITISNFKFKFNKLQYKKKSLNKNSLHIIIFNPPLEIKCPMTQEAIIKEFHDTPIGGHNGIKRTINKIKQRFSWRKMRNMVIKYISNCQLCRQNKQIRHTREKMVITDTPTSVFETVIIDTVGPLKISNFYRYLLTVQCDLSKYVVAVPMENKESKSIAKALVNNVILIYGAFKTVKSDRGTEFINNLFSEITKFLQIKHVPSTPFHHETLGTVERNHRVLNEYLLSFTNDFNWDEWIPYFLFSYNTTPHSDTGYSPFELVFGKISHFPVDPNFEINDAIYNYDNYFNELKFRLKIAHSKANELLKIAKSKRKSYFDRLSNPINISENDLVYIKKGNRRKIESPYNGPYHVIKDLGANCKIKIGNEIKEIHKNRLKKAL